MQGNALLLHYFMDRLYDRFKDIEYVSTFQQLKTMSESGGRTPDTPDDSMPVPKPLVHDATREQYRKKILDEQHEDAWFSKDDEMPQTTNGFKSPEKDPDSSSVASLRASEHTIDVASPTPPVPPPITLERMEEELFPEILQELEKKRKRDDDDELDSFFENLARPNKKPKGTSD
jgi:hypothetical protein